MLPKNIQRLFPPVSKDFHSVTIQSTLTFRVQRTNLNRSTEINVSRFLPVVEMTGVASDLHSMQSVNSYRDCVKNADRLTIPLKHLII